MLTIRCLYLYNLSNTGSYSCWRNNLGIILPWIISYLNWMVSRFRDLVYGSQIQTFIILWLFTLYTQPGIRCLQTTAKGKLELSWLCIKCMKADIKQSWLSQIYILMICIAQTKREMQIIARNEQQSELILTYLWIYINKFVLVRDRMISK